MKLLALIVVSGFFARHAAGENGAHTLAANPIRRVVTMLQKMQKRVVEEGKKEEQMFDKYMCWCKTGGADLQKSIAASNTKVPALQSDIEASEAEVAQLKEDLKAHQKDRSEAKAAMAEATSIREKEAAAFAKEKADLDANIDAITKAVAALEKGMAGGFLQTGAAQALKKLVIERTDMLEADRQDVLAFFDWFSERRIRTAER